MPCLQGGEKADDLLDALDEGLLMLQSNLLQVNLRAIPVRCLALDGIVEALVQSLPQAEMNVYQARVEEGKSAVNKLIKMLWWLQTAAIPVSSVAGAEPVSGAPAHARAKHGHARHQMHRPSLDSYMGSSSAHGMGSRHPSSLVGGSNSRLPFVAQTGGNQFLEANYQHGNRIASNAQLLNMASMMEQQLQQQHLLPNTIHSFIPAHHNSFAQQHQIQNIDLFNLNGNAMQQQQPEGPQILHHHQVLGQVGPIPQLNQQVPLADASAQLTPGQLKQLLQTLSLGGI
jgi:hypothetical protein